jgi:acetate kinase
MNVLVFNAGSSSLKFGLYQCAITPRPIVVGEARDFGKHGSRLTARDGDGSVIFEDNGGEDLEGASRQIIAKVQGSGHPVPEAVGHRIVHGGSEVLDHCLIDDLVMRKLNDGATFAPLHGRSALSILEIARAAYRVPHVACLDTVFHRSMPRVARQFPLPLEFAARGLHRYGFHGLSCESIIR